MRDVHNLHHVVKGGAEIIQELAPLRAPKSPTTAFALGLAFGAVGVALYFKSARDLFICLGLFLAASVLLPGLGSVLGWFFAPCYGAYRAYSSNAQLR